MDQLELIDRLETIANDIRRLADDELPTDSEAQCQILDAADYLEQQVSMYLEGDEE